MPVSALRSSTRGRPPLGRGGRWGSRGSMICRSSSECKGLAMGASSGPSDPEDFTRDLHATTLVDPGFSSSKNGFRICYTTISCGISLSVNVTSLTPASSQSGARGIVYELDTLRHRVGRCPGQLSRAGHATCVILDRLTTTEQCQVAASPVWDGPHWFLTPFQFSTFPALSDTF